MDWSTINWKSLERLRAAFLAGTAGNSDYWESEAALVSYDATFAQRIGWKWDYVLAELSRRGWTPPKGDLLDWGCGSGIASRAFLNHFGEEVVTGLHLWDRSILARSYAARRATKKYPRLNLKTGLTEKPEVLLISHVLTELTPDQNEALANLAADATAVLWIEPGTYDASRALINVREKLRGRMDVIAPCTHQQGCGMLTPQNGRHWCHHFAKPPPEVFTDGNWSRFAKFLGIDLRDLALSFLVLDKRPAPPLPSGATRVIGHPRIYKPHALLLGCDESGVRERKLTRRTLPNQFRSLKKGLCEAIQVWKRAGDEIMEAQPLTESRAVDNQVTPPLET